MTDPLALDLRTGLPEALRVLLAEYPRSGWESDPNFGGLVEFWLDRHMMFRRLMEMMRSRTEALVDRSVDPAVFGREISRYGSVFVNELHGHHRIEDAHYFPVLVRAEPRIERGFEILDRDHHALDGYLARFTEAANGVLRAIPSAPDPRRPAEGFLTEVRSLERLLDRHLIDEEELVVPVVLRHGAGGLG
jgi:hemerythrin-like domain-containing protein